MLTLTSISPSLDLALKDFDMALSLDQEFVSAYVGRDRTFELKGDHYKAIVDLRKALSLKSGEHEDDRSMLLTVLCLWRHEKAGAARY